MSIHHYIARVDDPAGFDWLAKLDESWNSKTGVLHGMHLQYLHGRADQNYASSFELEVPDMRPIEWGYAITSKGSRVFCYVIEREVGATKYGYCFRVQHVVLMLPASGLRMKSGATFSVPPKREVLAPRDGVRVYYPDILARKLAYFVMSDSPSLSAPNAGAGASSESWQATMTMLGMGSESTSSTSQLASAQPQVAPLNFHVGSPIFSSILVNQDKHLAAVVQSLCAQGDGP